MKLIDLKGKLKVGDRVRTPEGGEGFCSELGDGNVGTITKVDDNFVCIGVCYHPWNQYGDIELVQNYIITDIHPEQIEGICKVFPYFLDGTKSMDWTRGLGYEELKIVDGKVVSYVSKPGYYAQQPEYQSYEFITAEDLLKSHGGDSWTIQNTRAYQSNQINKDTKSEKKGFMTNIIDKLKNLTLSKVDQTLRKHGFEDENGKRTSLANDMALDELLEAHWATRREAIVADLDKLDEENK